MPHRPTKGLSGRPLETFGPQRTPHTLPRNLPLQREIEQAVAAGDLRGGQRIDALAAKAQDGDADQRGEQLIQPQIAAVAALAQKQRRAVDGENLVAVAAFQQVGEAIRKLGRSEGVILHQTVDFVDVGENLAHTRIRAARGKKCENALAIGMCLCSGDQGAALPFVFNLREHMPRHGGIEPQTYIQFYLIFV